MLATGASGNVLSSPVPSLLLWPRKPPTCSLAVGDSWRSQRRDRRMWEDAWLLASCQEQQQSCHHRAPEALSGGGPGWGNGLLQGDRGQWGDAKETHSAVFIQRPRMSPIHQGDQAALTRHPQPGAYQSCGCCAHIPKNPPEGHWASRVTLGQQLLRAHQRWGKVGKEGKVKPHVMGLQIPPTAGQQDRAIPAANALQDRRTLFTPQKGLPTHDGPTYPTERPMDHT